ncbi:MAG: phosphate signaling complex protein PhoU [Negativicutes bacterium]|nr:phosphate signaling complex protein PhoU [Negativicutes bacterium]
MRKGYLDELAKIRDEICDMGHKTVLSVEAAVKALTTLNAGDAQESRQYEKAVDTLNALIDKACIVTIATQAPAATDVRFLVASLKIASEIERVADYANNIAKSVQKRLLPEDVRPCLELMPEIEILGRKAAVMMTNAVEAYQKQDAELAGCVREQDAEVNKLRKAIIAKLALLNIGNAKEQAALLEINNAVRYLERVADRATNVAEWVIYIATGFPAQKKK